MICIKVHPIFFNLKSKILTFGVFKNLKTYAFFEDIFQPWQTPTLGVDK